ncbi:MAG: flagellar hook-basal body complex protein [Ruminococcus sp.]|jgi:flagellar basal-body rod protein FlgG|nr:flagellar hook-basal body complex protein [Ruminococcus sp.]
MLRGYYTAANAMITEQRVLDVVSNNLANIGTAGYKVDNAVTGTFSEWLVLSQGRPNGGEVHYRTLDTTYTDLEQGSLQTTYKDLDLAIQGSVYFNIIKDDELLLTKAGQFNLDNEGYLTLGSIGRVADENGQPIQLMTDEFSVDSDGVITAPNGDQWTLGLTYVDEAADVEKVGDVLFRPYNGEALGNIPADYAFIVKQGAFERSTADLGKLQLEASSHQGVFNANATAIKILMQMNDSATKEYKVL